MLEKEYEAGRVSLSGYEVPVESVVRIVSVSEGVIRLHEDVGYAKMEIGADQFIRFSSLHLYDMSFILSDILLYILKNNNIILHPSTTWPSALLQQMHRLYL